MTGQRAGKATMSFVSDAAEKFRKFANTVMPFDVPETNVVNIEGY